MYKSICCVLPHSLTQNVLFHVCWPILSYVPTPQHNMKYWYYFHLSHTSIWNLYCAYFQRESLKYQIYLKAEQLNIENWNAMCNLYPSGSALTLSRIWLFATPWTVARQAPLSMWFSRQEYWSGLPFPSLGDLPNQEIKSASSVSLLHCRWILCLLSHRGSLQSLHG